MVTNYPQGLTATRRVVERERPTISVFARLLRALKQFLCGLHGHDSMLHFQERRVTLMCASCGHESPGWDIGQRRPRVRYQGDARRHLIVKHTRPVLVARKTA